MRSARTTRLARDARPLLAAACALATATGCGNPHAWLAQDARVPAEAPLEPVRCEPVDPLFSPSRPALLGSPPAALVRWAARAFPDHFRVGGGGRIGLVPNAPVGVALQADVRRGRVVLVSVQGHGDSAAGAPPLAREAVPRFLLEAAGCASYRLCDARLDLDEARYRGQTACPDVRVPVRVTTPRHGRAVVAIAVWLPRGPDGRWLSRPPGP